jgi:hypothetical protein
VGLPTVQTPYLTLPHACAVAAEASLRNFVAS